MSSNAKPFTTVTLEDGTFAVVRTDPRKPRYFEVIAIFSDVSRAGSYAEMENRPDDEPTVSTAAPQQHIVERTEVTAEPPVWTPLLCGAVVPGPTETRRARLAPPPPAAARPPPAMLQAAAFPRSSDRITLITPQNTRRRKR